METDVEVFAERSSVPREVRMEEMGVTEEVYILSENLL